MGASASPNPAGRTSLAGVPFRLIAAAVISSLPNGTLTAPSILPNEKCSFSLVSMRICAGSAPLSLAAWYAAAVMRSSGGRATFAVGALQNCS